MANPNNEMMSAEQVVEIMQMMKASGVPAAIGDVKNNMADLAAALIEARNAASASAAKSVALLEELDKDICDLRESLRQPATPVPVDTK